ncbi:MAG: 4-alpha-glucanotransferase [Gammaproteobacteria bacterium]|nr:4-alpha-glucanotransferase [Gammaproteobacteria bacterium]
MPSVRLPVFDRRRAGVLLALSSLEGALGRSGRAFVDWLADAGFSVWQILPAGPVGVDGSPYWVRSDQAGNPDFLDRAELPDPHAPIGADFLAAASPWLHDYALFEALTHSQGGAPFWRWPQELRDREPAALARAASLLVAEVSRIEREQYAFYLQWNRLHEHAHARGVRLFGDLPFYVGPSSVETWAHRALFRLAANGEPALVGGVPPDYFSELGQLWGNPVYDWQALQRTDFAWWLARVRAQLSRLDLLRIDHFRALAAHWAVPAGAADARGGAWLSTPGGDLLDRIRAEFPDLPLVAEDLGVITEDVLALKESFRLPGMRVLQFGFDGEAGNLHVPYRHVRECIVYTGTHDNDTTLGWYASLDAGTRARVDLYLRIPPGQMPEELIRAALGSVGELAVIPVQDLLGLDSAARLNTPGTSGGNWSWRLPAGALTPQLAARYAQLNRVFGRA